MDFIFDIVIPRSSIDALNLTEIFVHWGEDSFLHDPPRYKHYLNLIFGQLADIEYYEKYFGKFIDPKLDKENYVALRLLGSHLMDLEFLINNNSQEISNNKLILFLDKMFVLDTFLIFFIRDEECIDNKYMIHTKEELINKICDCLSWSSPEGALLVKS